MSAKPTVVLSYGCPRSGTSVVAAMCRGLEGVCYQKWKELSVLHPGKCDYGMLQLSQVFSECNLVFVRSVRHPIEIVKSFYALREGLVPSTGTIHLTSDERILEWIEMESNNTAEQIRRLRQDHPWREYETHVVEAKYEVLSSEDRTSFVDELASLLPCGEINRQRLEEFLSTSWGNKMASARTGRLSAGVDVILRPEKEGWWREQLMEVMEREGYSA